MARILVTEHNPTLAAYLAVTLRKAGHTVIQADNCLEAWRTSSRESFDILMVDVVMPGIDGFVLAQKVLQDNPELQVIFITGFSGMAMDTKATPAYAPAPITTRPFHLTEIASRVRYLLGQGGLPLKNVMTGTSDGTVVYADFNRKQFSS